MAATPKLVRKETKKIQKQDRKNVKNSSDYSQKIDKVMKKDIGKKRMKNAAKNMVEVNKQIKERKRNEAHKHMKEHGG